MRTEKLGQRPGRGGFPVPSLCPSERPSAPGPYGANVEDSVCCRDYARRPLPPRLVKYYYWTSDSCRRPGVVLRTIKDREICADPRVHWVKKILQNLD
ncbi:PREDICTED: C-C motif chemokine 22 isoform X1 [Myotis davidii]|uniref:C-C motif chemokine 22 isoform X1 n=1 Tax=Myotis davidii TaxID=225400 RepID=UPI00076787D4|nr:PREDICTED: C-C motif chemokine 22 isoform X1 [Myotis davidii]